MRETVITEAAPAKVNLTLRVGAPREDGYHPLDSLVVFADWGDRIELRPADGLMLVMSGEPSRDLDPGFDNLVMKAALALQQASGCPAGAIINLHKDIPVEAGLGGGSADAAAILRGLNALWELDWPIDRLAQLGLTLGADVPACLYSKPLRMRGIGEWIELVEGWPDMHAVIVNPGVAVPTGPIFRAYDASDPPRLGDLPFCDGEPLDWLAREGNDLEAPAMAQTPQIIATLDWLRAQSGVQLVRMSGSGASCFALCESEDTAKTVAGSFNGFARAVRLAGSSPTRPN